MFTRKIDPIFHVSASAGHSLPLTNADLIVSLRISNAFKLELLQRLRESLHGDRKTLGERTDVGCGSVS